MLEDGITLPDHRAEIRRQELAVIDEALREGNHLHGFLSPERLRVITLQQGDTLTGYAARHSMDMALGYVGYEYKGARAAYQPVSGDLRVTSLLDSWVLLGNTIDAYASEDGQIVCDLKASKEVKVPEKARRQAQKGLSATWRKRGFTFMTSLTTLPDGQEGLSTEVIDAVFDKPRDQAFMYQVRKTGRGRNFSEALEGAFAAVEVEIPRVSPS